MHPTLTTDRLTLRPLEPADGPAVERGCGSWNVARMTTRIPHPYPPGSAVEWIANRAPDAHHFAIEHQGDLIGVISHETEIGYWLAEPFWGRGFATEAARRVVAFAFDDLRLDRLVSGHFADNPASGRVLQKCGFRYTGEIRQFSTARNQEVVCRRMALRREDHPEVT